jgi:SAM-dependent methyltransferase
MHAMGGTSSRDRVRLAATYRRIRRAARGRTVESVYEVGYGSGGLLRMFLDDGCRVAGCDPGALEAHVDPEVRRRGVLTTDPVAPGTGAAADLVVAVHVVEHLPDVHDGLRAIMGMVRPGGLAFVTTPTTDCWGFRRFGESWWMLEDPTHERFYSEESLARGLLDAGATAVTVTRPALDSLGCDGASFVRTRRWRGDAALDTRSGIVVSAAVAVPSLLSRAVSPAFRPVLDAVAAVP